MATATDSTPAALIALRDRALAYDPPGALESLGALVGTLAAELKGPYGRYPAGSPRFFQHQPPDGLPFASTDAARPEFYAVGTMGTARPAEDGVGFLTFPWEVVIYGRPRAAFARALLAGQAVFMAYAGWCTPDGTLRVLEADYAPLPPFTATPADREVVGMRVTATVHAVPTFLLPLAS
jgi:hypothetical protein